MTDDAKEWVTVKVEKPVRDDAQDDPRTYTEIMRDGMKDNKQADPDDLQEAFGLPDEAFPDDFTLEINDDLAGGVPADLREQLDRIESAASTAEERTGSIENTLENMGGR